MVLSTSAVAEAGRQGALVVCFPGCFVPGYRWPGTTSPSPDPEFLERAWAEVADAARTAGITVILGTERVTERGLQITACVINPKGTVIGWQDKGQIDPEEEAIYPALATERRVFTAGPLTFGVVICHEGWRYPETVRWPVRRGAQVVFHPHALPAPRRRSRGRTVPCSASNPTDKRACSWRTWTSAWPPGSSPRGAGPRRYKRLSCCF